MRWSWVREKWVGKDRLEGYERSNARLYRLHRRSKRSGWKDEAEMFSGESKGWTWDYGENIRGNHVKPKQKCRSKSVINLD